MRGAAAALPRPGEALRQVTQALRRGRPRWSRRRLVYALLVIAALGAAYMLWFRDSAFVRVERVTVTGLSGTDAARERAALIAAARGMTTLHYDERALRRALGAGATIESLRVTAQFPHALRIAVVEKAPVAVLDYGSERVAVGSGGVLLPDVEPIPHALPAIVVGAMPAHGRLGDGRARRLVAAAAALPPALRTRVVRLRELPASGLVGYLRDGPRVLLGAATELEAKWITAAAILADEESRGASYVDVRIPERAVAGGVSLPPAAPIEPAPSAAAPAPSPAAVQPSP